MAEDYALIPSVIQSLNGKYINEYNIENEAELTNIFTDILNVCNSNYDNQYDWVNSYFAIVNINTNKTTLMLPHTFDLYTNFKHNGDNKISCYIGNTLYTNNITAKKYTNMLHTVADTDIIMTELNLFDEIKLVSSNPINISFSVRVFKQSYKQQYINSIWKQIPVGTILKRLQNPNNELGKYFTYENEDINKCGISKYYSHNGMEYEKKLIYIKVIKPFDTIEYIARDTYDDWSLSGIPEMCKGGAKIIKDIHQDYFILL